MLIFDKTLRPQDDIFGYVNNNWLKNNPIPSEENKWGTFYILRDKSLNAIKKIVEELSNTSDESLTHDQKLIKIFFSAALSYPKYRDNHLKTLSTELQKIKNINNKIRLSHYLGYAQRCDYCPFWINYVSADNKNSQVEVLRFHQGELCLPSRDYYLENTKRMKNVRKHYDVYFQAVKKIIPEYSPTNWNTILEIEKKLAKLSWNNIELRDVEKNYTRFTINELQTRYKDINWLEYFNGFGWKKPNDNIVVDQPSFFDGVMDIIENYSLYEIKEYLAWNVINQLLGWIDKETAKIRFDFFGKIVSGRIEENPIWKRVVKESDDLMIGEILGREYASRYFPESSKKAVLEIVDDIRTAYHERIDKVVWMKDNSKKLAHKKLDNINVLIGYPSVWHDISKLELFNNNHCLNILAINNIESDLAIARIGKKPLREIWQMNAHTVNAYFDSSQLVMCFPAGILQPPFFSPKASYATNVGGIGSVIGHELTHGFDDQGAEFDENGNMNNWQTKSEKKLFKKLAHNIVTQAESYEALPGIFLKGKLILGEAIADIGGLELSIQALRNKVGSKTISKSLQDLFINYADYNCNAQRDEDLELQVKTNPHPPARFRVNNVLMHIDAFYDAFKIKSGDKLYLPPDERAHIW